MEEDRASGRATHEQSPTVSAVPVGIPDAIKRVLDPYLDRAESSMVGNRAEFLAWRKHRGSIPIQIVEAIWEAGYVLTPLGGAVATNVRALGGDGPWNTSVRAQMEMPRVIAYAEKRLPFEYLRNERFLRDYLPRELANSMWAVFRDQVEMDLLRAIARVFPAQGTEARRAATTGAVHDGPVRKDAPGDHSHD